MSLDNTSVYSTAYLLGAYGVIDRPKAFLYDLCFTMEQLFDTEEVYFDKVQRARRLAPLVSPASQGKAERVRGYYATALKPAYVKPKHVIEPNRMLKRRPGEVLLGNMSPAERRDATIMDTMQIQDDQISRREEWMACAILQTGSVTLNDPETGTANVINFQRPAGQTIALTGAARWGQAGVDPLDNLRTWAAQVQKGSGFHPSTVIFDPLSANAFIKSPGVQLVMNTFRQTVGNIDLGGKVVGGIGREAKYLGNTGEFEFWVYQQYYTDDAGNVTQLMPDNSLIMVDPVGVQGTRCYGAIQDVRVLRAMSRFPKNWIQEDPSVEYLMTQSAPLPVAGWIEASLAATVA